MLFATITVLSAFCAVSFAAAPSWTNGGSCGKSKYADAGAKFSTSGFIVGGKNARAHEFPYQVSIRNQNTNSHFCGGSIINEYWILTAAHCLEGEVASRLYVDVGIDKRSDSKNSARQTHRVSQIIMHPLYNSRTSQNDIALLKLATKIVFSADVQPICAPDSANSYVHYKVFCSGWGTLKSGGACCPDTLQYVALNTTTNEYCKAAYGRLYPITSDMICSTDNKGSNERDSCQGDSGGPLAIKDANGTFRLVGVVSWGIGCASGYPGVYARVTYFNDWISKSIK